MKATVGRKSLPSPDGQRGHGKTPRRGSRVFRRFDGVVPREQIQAYCDAIAHRFQPQKIILFGFYAYGKPTRDSDVDLLVVLPFQGSDTSKAIEIRSGFDTPFAMDLIVRKPEFIARRRRERDMFIEHVFTQGVVMYAAW